MNMNWTTLTAACLVHTHSRDRSASIQNSPECLHSRPHTRVDQRPQHVSGDRQPEKEVRDPRPRGRLQRNLEVGDHDHVGKHARGDEPLIIVRAGRVGDRVAKQVEREEEADDRLVETLAEVGKQQREVERLELLPALVQTRVRERVRLAEK